jgi:hypothetical protein
MGVLRSLLDFGYYEPLLPILNKMEKEFSTLLQK